MAGKRQRENGTWEFKFQKKGVLPTPVYFTFETVEDGEAYEKVAEEQLARGVVPPEMQDGLVWTELNHLFDAYEASGMSTKSDAEMFGVVSALIGRVKLTALNYDWVEAWVQQLKAAGLAPSTMKKRVEFLGRALAWAMRKNKISLQNNPVQQLPKGYATKDVPKEQLWAGQRDRRLEPKRTVAKGWDGVEKEFQTEEGAIRYVLRKKEEHVLFDMAIETAMRMSEMVTLKKRQIDFGQDTIFLDETKNGNKRQVPMSSVIKKILEDYLPTLDESREEIFPWWTDPFPGKNSLTPEEMEIYKKSVKKATNALSTKWGDRHARAGCPDLTFHDLRHEGTSRIFERTNLTDTEISSITGHEDPRMLKRYANLRGSKLAKRLW